MRVADPVSGRPGIDVQVLLVAVPVLYGVRSACVAHLTELPDDFVDEIEVAFTHLDPVTDVCDGSGSSASPSRDPVPGCRAECISGWSRGYSRVRSGTPAPT